MTDLKRIAVVPGDGIGPEVIDAGLAMLKAATEKRGRAFEWVHKDWGAEKWLREGVGIPEGGLKDLEENYDAVYFGALGDPRIPDMAHGREILLGMRFGLDLFVNMRPVELVAAEFCPLKNKGPEEVNFIVFRENTEDLYVSVGGNFKKDTPDEVAVDESVHTRKGVERIIRYAFEFAKNQGRQKVTLGDKSNAVRFGGSLWQRTFKAVAAEYPDIDTDHFFVDVLAMELVRRPEHFDVIVTGNLFGDILSDLGAGLVGGLGLAASGNLHPGKIALFEPVHGSAPDIAGQDKANPIAAALTGAMMMTYLGEKEIAQAIQESVQEVIASGEVTSDLGGSLGTKAAGEALTQRVLGKL